MPKVSDAHLEETRSRILRAAGTCLARLGVDGTTTRAVAEEAGVANGLLYRYFPTKEALLVAVAGHEAATRTPVLLAAGAHGDWPSRIGAVARSLFDGATRATSLLPALRAQAVADASMRRALKRYDRELIAQAGALLAAAVADGAARDDDPEATVEAIQAMFEGVQARLASRTVTTDPARLGRAAAALVERLAEPAR